MLEGIIKDGYNAPFFPSKNVLGNGLPTWCERSSRGDKESQKPQPAPHCSHGEIQPRRASRINQNMTAGDGRGAKPGATAAARYVLYCLGPGYNKGFPFKVCFPGLEQFPAAACQGHACTPAAPGPGEA